MKPTNWKEIVEYLLSINARMGVQINNFRIKAMLPYAVSKTFYTGDYRKAIREFTRAIEAKFPNVKAEWLGHKNLKITEKK